MLWAAGAATESLWLDELHTSWVVAGPWSDVASRARQGNQSPLFFWVLGGLTKTLGNLGGVQGELTCACPPSSAGEYHWRFACARLDEGIAAGLQLSQF
ncbi:MAG: hypothetical protein R3C56_04880 [Pirellulaceae bacterium]